MTAPAITRTTVRDGVGESVIRPDGAPKVKGEFEYLGDMNIEGQLWMYTLRSELGRAKIVSIDKAPALALPGVHAVLTVEDVPGLRYQGQVIQDQPVLAEGEIRHWGEAIAITVAEDEEAARRAAEAIVVELEPLPALVDQRAALDAGETYRTVTVRGGDPDARGEVVVEGDYEIAFQDQAALGTEAGVAIPDGSGGVDLWGPTQWTHSDLPQLTACLDIDESQIRVHVSGIGGAFGSREDLSLQTHLAMAALKTGRPVKGVYDRNQSFAGHVKRHKAIMRYRHEADRDGTLARVEAELLFDGGAYHMTSDAVVANATFFAAGPYRVRSTHIESAVVRTNHLPAGAMRGFGSNQVMFAVEAQMDRLADELGMDPVELRMKNILRTGDRMPTTGQVITDNLPTEEVIRTLQAMPIVDEEDSDDPRRLPGGAGNTSDRSHTVRGVGYALGFKNLMFSEGFDDYAEAEVELNRSGAVIRTAAIEVGQGMITVLQQIVRSALGVSDVEVEFVDTSRIGSAGSTSASRQTQMAGGAVLQACEQVLARAEGADLDLLLLEGPIVERARFRHPDTVEPDEHGQGDLHADFSFGAQRAVVDVDVELGLVRMVQIDAVHEVGKALNPMQVIGQIEGGAAQGAGHAVMEELIYDENAVLLNPNFTDYLIPTFLDMPEVESVVIEEPSSWGPFGAKGFSENPTVTATPAVLAAVRNATGLAITHAPVRPDDIALRARE